MVKRDKFRIDSHKLIYHVPRVHEWFHGKNIYPIYTEIGLFGGCNHRCIFCAFDFLNYKPDILNKSCLKKSGPGKTKPKRGAVRFRRGKTYISF